MSVSEKHRETANDIMDSACLPQAMVNNGIDKCLRIDIINALSTAHRRYAH